MTHRRLCISLVAVAATLAGCGGIKGGSFTPSATVGTATQKTAGHAYKVLYSFRGQPHSSAPYAGLVDVSGTLYGTTSYGGTYDAGTFFRMTPSGKEADLRSFYGTRGALPLAPLIDVKGTLYGTTELGGKGKEGCSNDHCGTVFSITTSGTEKVLYSFSGSDGAEPQAPLIEVKGTFYGTTISGGANGEGTVFSVTPSGQAKVLHSFGGGQDGVMPSAGLIDVDGILYGTTQYGGALSCACGTIFSITRSGKETVIHSFSGVDGANPTAGLLEVNRILYGTTDSGGYNCGSAGTCGTVFKITLSGKETVLYHFSGADGALPWAKLIDVNGTLYGTTREGGAVGSDCAYPAGCGTVFSITTSGKETVLHSFGNYGDGQYPFAGLLNVAGTLYGMTPYGGLHGHGIAFSLKL